MEQLRTMAGLRKAFNVVILSRDGQENKYECWLAKELHCGSGSVYCSCFIRVAKCRGENRSPPEHLCLCIRSPELCLAVSRKWQETEGVRLLFRGAGVTMVRERMPCRRGSGNGQFPRPPAANLHHHCCCVYCHRRGGANPIPARQILEVGNSVEMAPSLPAFGSVVFSLGSSEGSAGVNAHISVLFTNSPEVDDDGSSLVLMGEVAGQEKGKLPLGESSTMGAPSEKGKGKAVLGESSTAVGTSGGAYLPPHPQSPYHILSSPSQSTPATGDSEAEGDGGSRSMEEETED